MHRRFLRRIARLQRRRSVRLSLARAQTAPRPKAAAAGSGGSDKLQRGTPAAGRATCRRFASRSGEIAFRASASSRSADSAASRAACRRSPAMSPRGGRARIRSSSDWAGIARCLRQRDDAFEPHDPHRLDPRLPRRLPFGPGEIEPHLPCLRHRLLARAPPWVRRALMIEPERRRPGRATCPGRSAPC